MADPTPDDIEGRAFRLAFRGYDQIEVADFLSRVAGTVRTLTAERDRLLADLGPVAGRDLAAELDAATAEIGEVLQSARAAAEAIRSQAAADAHRWREEASLVTGEERTRIAEEIEQARIAAAEEIDAHVADARRSAEETRSAAEQQALKLVGDAERDAHRMLTAARKEVEDIGRNARSEADRLLAEAQLRHDEIIANAQRLVDATQERARALEARRDELRREVEEMRRLLGTLDASESAPGAPADVGTGESGRPEVGRPAAETEQTAPEESRPVPWEPGGTVRVVRPTSEVRRSVEARGVPVEPDEALEIRVIPPAELARRRSEGALGDSGPAPGVETVGAVDAVDEGRQDVPPETAAEATAESAAESAAEATAESTAESAAESGTPGPPGGPVEVVPEEVLPVEAFPEGLETAAEGHDGPGAPGEPDEEPETESEPAAGSQTEEERLAEPRPQPDVSGIFARLRAPSPGGDSDDARHSASAPAVTPAPESPTAIPGTAAESEPSPDPGTVSVPVEPAIRAGIDPFGLRDRLVLPVANRALRNLKRQLTDQQNAALEEVRLDEAGWEPDPENLAGALRADLVVLMSESYAAGHAAAEDMLGTRIKRPSTPRFDVIGTMSEALSEDVALVLREGRAAGQGGRQLAVGVSRVFRGWRTDEAERRVRDWSFEAYHAGLVDSLREAGSPGLRWVVAGRGCASCRAAATEPVTALPPGHAGCGCTVVGGPSS